MLLWWIMAGCVISLRGAVVVEQPIDRVEVEVGFADVDIRAVEDGLPTVGFDFVGLGEGELDPSVVGGVLRVGDPCGASELCAGTLSLELPADVDVQAAIREGGLRMYAMRGDVTADVGGRIVLERHTGRQVDVANTLGDRVELEFDAAPERVAALSDSGGVHVTLPGGTYALDLQASGDVMLDPAVEHDPTSPFEIMLTATAGEIVVEAR